MCLIMFSKSFLFKPQMEFKKRMLSDFTSMVNEALIAYKKEYEEIAFATNTENPKNIPYSMVATEVPYENEHEEKEQIDVIEDHTPKCDILIPKDLSFVSPKEENRLPDYNSVKFEETSVKRDIIRCDVANSSLFESGLANSINQSFYNGEGVRRRAKRRTGKVLLKRRHEMVDQDDQCLKRRRTDQIENFLKLYSASMKTDITEYESKIKQLETKLKESEKKQLNQAELERIKSENIATSKKLDREIRELQKFKESILNEVKKLEEIKRFQLRKEDIEESMIKEKKAIQDELMEQKRLMEAEKTMIVEERIKMEHKLLQEEKRLNEERIRLEKEKNEQMKKIIEERIKLEKDMAEKTFSLEFEKRLMADRFDQSMVGHSSRLAQGILKNKEPKIVLPTEAIMDAEKRKTILQKNPKPVLNELFQAAKNEHFEKVNQSQLASSMHFFTKTVPKIKTPNSNVQLDKIDAHNLYKRSIDAQSIVTDAKKYVPKTQIPHYNTEDEFESDEKKFQPALFTKDPKLSYIVKSQNHDEIRNFFGNRRDIDVEAIFNEIENVSNYSPNKLRKSD